MTKRDSLVFPADLLLFLFLFYLCVGVTGVRERERGGEREERERGERERRERGERGAQADDQSVCVCNSNEKLEFSKSVHLMIVVTFILICA